MKPPVAKKRKWFFDFDSEDTVNYDSRSIADAVTVLAGVAESYLALTQLDVDNVSLCLAAYYTPKAFSFLQFLVSHVRKTFPDTGHIIQSIFETWFPKSKTVSLCQHISIIDDATNPKWTFSVPDDQHCALLWLAAKQLGISVTPCNQL